MFVNLYVNVTGLFPAFATKKHETFWFRVFLFLSVLMLLLLFIGRVIEY